MLSIVAPIQCDTHSDQNGDQVSLMQKSLKLEEHPKVIATIMKQVKDNLDGIEDPDGNEGKLREEVKDMLGDKISQLQGTPPILDGSGGIRTTPPVLDGSGGITTIPPVLDGSGGIRTLPPILDGSGGIRTLPPVLDGSGGIRTTPPVLDGSGGIRTTPPVLDGSGGISQLQGDSKASGYVYVSIGQGACGGRDTYGTRTFAKCTADCNREKTCSAVAFKSETSHCGTHTGMAPAQPPYTDGWASGYECFVKQDCAANNMEGAYTENINYNTVIILGCVMEIGGIEIERNTKNKDLIGNDGTYWGWQECEDKTKEFEVDLCSGGKENLDLANRLEAVQKFRDDILEHLEDDDADTRDWFKHKGGNMDELNQQAHYYRLVNSPEALSDEKVEIRYRRVVGGNVEKKLGKTDIGVKFKSTTNDFALRPFTRSEDSTFKDRWSCKREENYLYTSADGVVLDFAEQQGRYKGPKPGKAGNEDGKSYADSSFAKLYNEPNALGSMSDIDDLFPGLSGFYGLDKNSNLEPLKEEWRWVSDNLEMELNTEGDKNEQGEIEGAFTLWYETKEDMEAGTNPTKGVWSFKIEKGEDNENYFDRAKILLNKVGEKLGCP